MVVCADALLLISSGSFSFCTMEEQQEPRTVELNDGRKMPLLGLGTWKVMSCSKTLMLFYFLILSLELFLVLVQKVNLKVTWKIPLTE